MASISFDTSELDRLAGDLIVGGVRVVAGAKVATLKSAKEVEALAQQLAPVLSGSLRSSITTTIAGDGAAEIGPSVPYGVFVEYGTSVMAPQPYLGPALEARAGAFEAALGVVAEQVL